MQNPLPLVDALASKSDQWLFLATLVVLGFATFLAFRWLVSKHEKLMEQSRADQQEYSKSLINITAEHGKTTRELAVVLDRCAASHQRCADVIEENTKFLSKAI
jgi:hypothetical protein